MKTDEFAAMLGAGAGAVDADAPQRGFVTAVGWGALGAALLMAILLGVRHDLARASMQPMFWVKLGYVLSLALASLAAVSRLSRPGSTLTGIVPALAAPVIAIWILTAIVLAGASPADRVALVMGKTWTYCPWLIATLSVPLFVALAWAMKGGAPTRPRLAGAAVGLASGSLAAVVYSLHCPEMGAPFLGSWYLLGMMIPTTIGALFGRRLYGW